MEKIFNNEALRSNVVQSVNPIVIPIWIFNNIISLCTNYQVERSGYLLCYENIVEYPALVALGMTGSVFPKKKIVFNNSPNYKSIEFHVHPTALGDYWAAHFSSIDYQTFYNRLSQEGQGYTHILFTPENVLTWHINNPPDIRIGFGNSDIVYETFCTYNEKHKSWNIKQSNLNI